MQNAKTSPQQYERMVNLLSDYPEIAQNFTKRTPEIVASFWEDLANQLNSMGPRQRDVGGWKKVWSDFKCYIKKKLTSNQKGIQGTGGGPYSQKSFTPLEDAVIALIHVGKSVSGIGAKSFGSRYSSQQVPQAETTSDVDHENQASTSTQAPSSQLPNAASTTQRATRQRRPMTSIQLLTKQVKNQETHFKELKYFFRDTTKTLKRVNRSIDAVCEIEEKKLKEMQAHNSEMRRLAVQKLELRRRKLEVEIAKANIYMD